MRRRAGRPRTDRLAASRRAPLGPTPEQLARRQALVGRGAPQELAENALGVLLARGILDRGQYEAGCRFARLYRLAVGRERLAAVNLTGRLFDGPESRDEAWLAARASDYAAARRLLQKLGRRTRELVENVAVYQRLPGFLLEARPPGPGERQALGRLAQGLSLLDRHFTQGDLKAA